MAAILELSPRSFQDMIDAGCPVVRLGGRGQATMVDIVAVIRWVRERDRRGESLSMTRAAEDALDARRRNAEAQAQLREHELARLRSQTVLVSEVRPVIAEELANVRSRLIAMPGRLAPQLAGVTDRREVEDLLAEEVREALAELTADVREFVLPE